MQELEDARRFRRIPEKPGDAEVTRATPAGMRVFSGVYRRSVVACRERVGSHGERVIAVI